jgi:DNA-binding NtrC family response regulator
MNEELVYLGATNESSGIPVAWSHIEHLMEMAERFYRGVSVSSSEEKTMDRIAGIPYSRAIYRSQEWGEPIHSNATYRRCLGMGLLGVGRHMLRDVVVAIEDCVSVDESVMITGDTGTGKEMVAQLIHNGGNRSGGPFVAVNCAGLPRDLLLSELFGHKKGGFTGAIKDRKGHFEQADGGTIFLDEIGDMPPDMQAMVLRVLNSGEVIPVGSESPEDHRKVDVRVIAATHQDITDSNVMRTDLYHRLNTIEIRLYPLFLRPDDLLLLTYYFLQEWNAERQDAQIAEVSSAAIEDLATYTWPGNIRELRNVLRRACVTAVNRHEGSDVIAGLDVPHDSPWPYQDPKRPTVPLSKLLELDLYQFMATRDEEWKLWPHLRGSWKLLARYRTLSNEQSPETDGRKENADTSSASTAFASGPTIEDFLSRMPHKVAVENFTRAYVRYHFEANDGNQKRTAEAIGVNRSTVARYTKTAMSQT